VVEACSESGARARFTLLELQAVYAATYGKPAR